MFPTLFKLPLWPTVQVSWTVFVVLVALLMAAMTYAPKIGEKNKLLGQLLLILPAAAFVTAFVAFVRTPFKDGILPINSYGFAIMVGFLLASWIAVSRAKPLGIKSDFILDLGIISPALSDDWRESYRHGDYAGSLARARSIGVNKLIAELPPKSLADLADAARLGGDPELAVRALTALQERFPSAPEAREAKFLLGRVHALRGDRQSLAEHPAARSNPRPEHVIDSSRERRLRRRVDGCRGGHVWRRDQIACL
mgnify:CR=1 FL=1